MFELTHPKIQLQIEVNINYSKIRLLYTILYLGYHRYCPCRATTKPSSVHNYHVENKMTINYLPYYLSPFLYM